MTFKSFFWYRCPGLTRCLLAIALFGLSASCDVVRPSVEPGSDPQTTPTTSPPPLAVTVPIDNDGIVSVVDRVGPAVVRINASRTVSSGGGFDSLLTPFGRGKAPQRVERGTGSGFIFDADGLILTNAHVIDEADQVSVVLKDGQRFQGKVLGADPLTDVAVVKIEAKDLPTATLGNSEALKTGQWAIAIGNPLGLDNTVTVGIVSATGRSSAEVGNPAQRVKYIQTDAAINPGNSGGPLLDLQGQVIGVNTAIRRDAQGLGFAIPIALAHRIAQQLITTGEVAHAYLGISMADNKPELRSQLKAAQPDVTLPTDPGVFVMRVVRNSPAAEAGVKPGDLIMKIDGDAVQESTEVQAAVEAVKPGDTLTLTVKRQAQTLTLPVQVGTLSPDTFN